MLYMVNQYYKQINKYYEYIYIYIYTDYIMKIVVSDVI